MHFIDPKKHSYATVDSKFDPTRFMKNVETGVCMPYHPITMGTAMETKQIDEIGTTRQVKFIEKATPGMIECPREEAMDYWRDDMNKQSKKNATGGELQNILAEIRGEPRVFKTRSDSPRSYHRKQSPLLHSESVEASSE